VREGDAMDVRDFKEVLHEALLMYMEDCSSIREITTLESEGMLCISENLVVITDDLSQFEILIIKRI
jgi:hypothetical protein